MTVLLGICAVLLGLSAVLVVVRMTLGPTMLDRAISFDVLIAIAICGIAVDAAVDRTTQPVPMLLVATLLGFVGSVAIARYSPGSDTVESEDQS